MSSLVCSVRACFSRQVIQTDQIWSLWWKTFSRHREERPCFTLSHAMSFFDRINMCIPEKIKSVLQCPDPPLCPLCCALYHRVCLFSILMRTVTLCECYSHNDSWYGQKGALRWNLEKETSSTPMPRLRKHAQPSYLVARCSRPLFPALQRAAQHQTTLKTLN